MPDVTEYTFRRIRVVTEETTVALPGRNRGDDAYDAAVVGDWAAVSETGEDECWLISAERVLG